MNEPPQITTDVAEIERLSLAVVTKLHEQGIPFYRLEALATQIVMQILIDRGAKQLN